MKIELNAREITALGKTIGGLLIAIATAIAILSARLCNGGSRASHGTAMERATQRPSRSPRATENALCKANVDATTY